MYFKQLSLDTLNESNQWNMLSEGPADSYIDGIYDEKNQIPVFQKIGEGIKNTYNAITNNTSPQYNDSTKLSQLMYPNTALPVNNGGIGGGVPAPDSTSTWDTFLKNIQELFKGNQQDVDRTGGFIAGYLSKIGIDSIKNWLFPPAVQQVAQEPEKMSALAGAGIGAAVTAGVLGLIWLYKKWQKRGQVTDQDIQYAAKLNQMKPEDIPEEDKNKPIEA